RLEAKRILNFDEILIDLGLGLLLGELLEEKPGQVELAEGELEIHRRPDLVVFARLLEEETIFVLRLVDELLEIIFVRLGADGRGPEQIRQSQENDGATRQ